MADGTHISWTDATWNPITGCAVISPGCTNCYAMRLAGTRLQHHPSRAGLTLDTKAGPVWSGETRFNEQWLDQPLHWRKPRRIFVVAHGDLFYKKVSPVHISAIVDVMRRSPWHEYQVLTKRTARMLEMMCNEAPMSHVLLGASVEDQTRADERRASMAELAALGWRTWVSYEPSLGAVRWAGWEFAEWFVSGGESGRDARPSHPDWHRATRDFCGRSGAAYHFKQWGEWAPFGSGIGTTFFAKSNTGRVLLNHDGRIVSERDVCRLPDDARISHCYSVGKKAAGAMLDGREWREMPERRDA